MPVIPPESGYRTDLDFSDLTAYTAVPESANELAISSLMSAKFEDPVKSVNSASALSQAISSAKSKTFAVQSTKQVVKDILNQKPALLTATDLSKFGPANFTNLLNKSGMNIATTDDLFNAIEKASASLMTSRSMTNSLDPSYEDLTSAIITAAPDKIIDSPTSFSDDLLISSIFSNNVPQSSFMEMRGLVRDLDQFNECPDLSRLGSGLLDLAGLLSKFLALVGLSGLFDVRGLLNCVGSVSRQFDVVSNRSAIDLLVERGSVNALSDLTEIGSISSIDDAYGTIRDLESNRLLRTDRYGRTTNKWTNPNVTSSADKLMTNLSINKSDMFSVRNTSTIKNKSISNSIADPIYDLSLIKDTRSGSGFADYCLGSNAELLSAIPT